MVKDVRINKDLSTKKVEEISTNDKIIDFREKQVPHFINSFAQVSKVVNLDK